MSSMVIEDRTLNKFLRKYIEDTENQNPAPCKNI